MCALEKYKCRMCPAGEMRDLLIAHQGVYKKAWLAALKNFTKRYDVESLSSAAFFKAYEESCVVQEKTQSPFNLSQRMKLCEKCLAVYCGHCKKDGCYQSNDSCQNCSKYPENFCDEASANVGQKCFFYEDYRKGIHITMDANEDLLDPRGICEQCLYCTAEEVGTERVNLQDLPLNGRPTEVTVIRERYARKHSGSKLNECPRSPLPGLQKTLNSRLTCRLYAACVVAALKGYSYLEISEWYNISGSYLRKIKKEQAERLEESKALLRQKLCMSQTRMDYSDVDIEGQPYRLYFAVPGYPDIYQKRLTNFNSFNCEEAQHLELISIYNEEEQKYLHDLLTNTIRSWHTSHFPRRPDISTSRVFSMAYDYAATQDSDVSAPADIFALVVTMADSFLCAPLAQVAYEYSALHWQMTLLIQKGGLVGELLALAEAISNLIPDSLSDSALAAYTNCLISQLKDLLCKKGDQMLKSLLECPHWVWPGEYLDIIDAVNLISEYMQRSRDSNDLPIRFDEIREDILFFNQAVVPYKYDSSQNKLLPQLDQYGDIDTSAIDSVGIRCSCLEHLLHLMLGSDGEFVLSPCKSQLFDNQYHLYPNSDCPMCDGSHCPGLTIEQ